MNGGTSSGYFNLGRGVRQGDPLSDYLFILVIELPAYAIRLDDNIKGISVGNRVIKSVIYADDLSATVSDIHFAKRLLELIECFRRFSGLKINFEKTEALWLGSLRNCKKQPLAILKMAFATSTSTRSIFFLMMKKSARKITSRKSSKTIKQS